MSLTSFSGVDAIRHLLKWAYEVPTSSSHYTKYIKYGSEQEAIDDFWSAKPALCKSSTTRAGVNLFTINFFTIFSAFTTRAGVIIFTTIHMEKSLASLTFYEGKI